ncbi:MAG: hypothetical protein JO168_27175 [Solirubrobacterales bacterium]|nr:hypothetical protein [Solirubrobacterales bacterium]
MLAGLAIAPAAGAAGWATQTTPNPFPDQIAGVACESAKSCMAVGYGSSGGRVHEAGWVWNGTKWTIPSLKPGDPLFDARDSGLFGVSCPAASVCEAVGYYINQTRAQLPLAVVWHGKLGRVSLSSQPMQLPPGATFATLSGVSCASSSDCEAVGYYDDAARLAHHPLIDVWDGTSWQLQAAPEIGSSALNAVSCPSTSACVAVGEDSTPGGGIHTFAERWGGSRWTPDFPDDPSPSDNTLTGVSCTSASACLVVGTNTDPATGQPVALAETTAAFGQWRLQPPPSPGHTFSRLDGVSCASGGVCIAVGAFDTFTGIRIPLVDYYDGSSWSFTSAQSPPFRAAELFGISCTSSTACTAGGDYIDASGNALSLADRYTGAGSPHALSLTRRGDVLALLRKPRRLELLVVEHGRRHGLLGAVPLGRHPKGRSLIAWNLRVGGRRLGAGTYTAELVSMLADGATSAGPSVTFALDFPSGPIRALSASCSVAAAAKGRC